MQSRAPENSVQNQLFAHFGLRENPFGGTPDPRFLFHSETHREALASLINGIDCEFGFQVLVAQPGMGKTTLLFNFLEGFRATAHTAFLFQPQLEPYELLQSLLSELGAGSEDTSVRKLSEQINQLLGRAAAERKRVIVVVDEAQNLDFAVLETLRQLSNFETAQAKLMQIVLSGQPQLVKKLASPEQEQLRQRISSIGRLSPLTLNETRAYINHRLRTAGYKGPELFAMGAVRQIWENAKGVPRKINTLCFNAMLLGFAASKRSIDEIILAEAARDLDMSSVLADMYRTEPGLVASHRDGVGSSSKIPPIRDAKSLETEAATLAYPSGAHGSFAQKAESHPAAAHSGPGNSGGTGESIPLALVEAIVRISQTLEEQKVLLAAAKSVAPAEALPAPAAASNKIASVAGQNPASSGQGLQPAPFAAGTRTTATIRRDSSASLEKGLPLTPEKGIPTLQKAAKGAAPPQSQKIAAASSNRPQLKKSSESGGFWAKALVLVAVTGILTFVVFEKSPWQNPAQANAEQSDSASGYAALHGSPASTTDGSSRPSQGTATTSRASREVGSDETNDVTVRQFPVEPVATGGSTGAQGSRNIFFDQDSAVIAERYRLALQHIADELAKDPDLSAILEGHTDDSGPEVYNLELSSRRATTVRNALINEFNVPSTRLTAIGSGSAAPVQPNSSAVGRAYNRRVAVRFVKLGE